MQDDDPVEAFMTDVMELQKRHGEVSSQFDDDDEQIYLASIAVTTPGKGIGTAFMREVEKLLDKHDLTIELEPEGDDASRDRLGGWYERHGFFWTGPHRMRRDPKPITETA